MNEGTLERFSSAIAKLNALARGGAYLDSGNDPDTNGPVLYLNVRLDSDDIDYARIAYDEEAEEYALTRYRA